MTSHAGCGKLKLRGRTTTPKQKRRVLDVTKRVALDVGTAWGGTPSRGEETEALLKASTHGFDKVLEDRESDETVYLVEGELLGDTELDTTDSETLKASLEKAGYTVVDLYKYLEAPHSF